MSRTRNNLWMPVAIVLIFVLGGSYWSFFQKYQIEPFARQIDSIKVNQNKPIEMKDYVLMKRDLITSQNTLNNSVFQLVTSLFLLFTAYTAWRNLVVSEKKQIVESFAKAVEQLGSDELHARVGGIFVLEQIAQSSPEYHWPVIEVLTSYIRDISLDGESTFKPFKQKPKTEEHYSGDNLREKTSKEIVDEVVQKFTEEPGISVKIDIQAALTVICRRNSKQDPEDKVIDLRFCDIRGANINNANLSCANLNGAKILRAQLKNADLSNAKLRQADLTEANLIGANLNGSSLNEAVLEGAYLQKADLQNSDLSEANLEGTHLQKAIFRGANLEGANFKNAELEGADFTNSKNYKNAKSNVDQNTSIS